MLDTPPPTDGRVTFVCTGIDGADDLSERVGSALAPALALHHRILRDVTTLFGGYEAWTDDHGFVLAFGRAEDAVAMSISAQRALQAAPWPQRPMASPPQAGQSAESAGYVLTVGMGIHIGAPRFGQDPHTGRLVYYGPVLKHAAGLLGAVHGGQIILSHATWRAIEGAAPGGVITDLGEHALAGLETRERLYQLRPEGLSARPFPPLRTPNLRQTNLTKQPDPFFGRSDALQRLSDAFNAGERLLTLTGSAGTGKTRLSRHFGATQLAYFPGGVWFVDLSEARTVSAIVAATAAALDVPLTQDDAETQLSDAVLGRGRALYLLDNFEQVIDAAQETVIRWLHHAPGATFIVTSRSPLRVAEERVYPLDPLPTADAMALFYDRGERALRGFSRTAENVGLVREIVERLDCLALAIELAAARVRMLPPARLLPRLVDARFQLLSTTRRDATARQATLRGALDWSWALLSPPEQSALAQLSVFHGGCSLESVEGVVDLPDPPGAPWSMDIIEALVDHSLRRVQTTPHSARYRLLESIRTYALEKLGPAVEGARARHAAHFATLGRPDQLRALETHCGEHVRQSLALEHENVRAALEFALESGDIESAGYCAMAAASHLHSAGPVFEAVTLLERIATETLAPPLRAQVLGLQSALFEAGGHARTAMTICDDAIEAARIAGDQRLVGRLLRLRARGHFETGEKAFARADLEDALRINTAVGDLTGEAQTRGAMAYYGEGTMDMEECRRQRERALALYAEDGNRAREASALHNLGSWYGDVGDQAKALDLTEKSLTIHRELGNRRSQAIAHCNLGLYHRDLDDIPSALEHYAQALRIAGEVGIRRLQAIAMGNKGDLLADTGDLDAAEAHYRDAIRICDDLGQAVIGGTFRGSLAVIWAQRGDLATARALIKLGVTALRGVHALEYGKLLGKMAKVEAYGGDLERAAAAVAEVETLIEEMGLRPDSEVHRGLNQAIALLSTVQIPSK